MLFQDCETIPWGREKREAVIAPWREWAVRVAGLAMLAACLWFVLNAAPVAVQAMSMKHGMSAGKLLAGALTNPTVSNATAKVASHLGLSWYQTMVDPLGPIYSVSDKVVTLAGQAASGIDKWKVAAHLFGEWVHYYKP